MIQKDYLMREIEKIPLVIAKLMNSKLNPLEDKQVVQEIDDGLNLFNVNIQDIKSTSPEKIFETIQNKDQLSLLINLVQSITLWDADVSLVNFLQYANTQKTEHSILYLQDSLWYKHEQK
ncbi:MAG: hypothetical protein LBU91_09485 [Bacteroidales bacterium]|jgi:hypothetical protein|nr:hypothetical protein [Bacteroidales bacterium]